MTRLAGAAILEADPNFTGESCLECGQIAFRIISAVTGSEAVQVPLCGRHYGEAFIDKRLPPAKSRFSSDL
jgi:hypothetical protein